MGKKVGKGWVKEKAQPKSGPIYENTNSKVYFYFVAVFCAQVRGRHHYVFTSVWIGFPELMSDYLKDVVSYPGRFVYVFVVDPKVSMCTDVFVFPELAPTYCEIFVSNGSLVVG